MRKRDQQRFKKILSDMRDQLRGNAERALAGDVHLDPDDFPDELDTASSEANLAFTGPPARARARPAGEDRTSRSRRSRTASTAQCETCEEEIEVKRLEARPVAELCIDCKAEQEKLERGMGG